MRCAICQKPEEEVELFEGILDEGIKRICADCSETENIPLIRKPSSEQIQESERRFSVRERMERLSTGRADQIIAEAQRITHSNHPKLRLPSPKQQSEKLIDNYFWALQMARRRQKLTTAQLSEKSGVSKEIIRTLEKGNLPENFEEHVMKIENTLGKKFLKTHEPHIGFIRPSPDKQKQILGQVKQKLENWKQEDEEQEPDQLDEETEEQKTEKINKISRGKFDFSKKENIQDITLNDLIDMKKKQEQQDKSRLHQKQNEEMLGDEVDLDLGDI